MKIYWKTVFLVWTLGLIFLMLSNNALANPNQYCYTKETIEVINGERVSSKTVVECNDNRIEKLVAKQAGMAKNCGTAQFDKIKGNAYVPRHSIFCQRPDGHWDVVIDTDRR